MKYQTGSRWELIWGNQRARGIFGNWAHYTKNKVGLGTSQTCANLVWKFVNVCFSNPSS